MNELLLEVAAEQQELSNLKNLITSRVEEEEDEEEEEEEFSHLPPQQTSRAPISEDLKNLSTPRMEEEEDEEEEEEKFSYLVKKTKRNKRKKPRSWEVTLTW